MEQEELDAEPSLDKMVDLRNPKVLAGLGKLAAQALADQASAKTAQSTSTPNRASQKADEV